MTLVITSYIGFTTVYADQTTSAKQLGSSMSFISFLITSLKFFRYLNSTSFLVSINEPAFKQ